MDDEELRVVLRNLTREQVEKLVLAPVRILGPTRRSEFEEIVPEDLRRSG
jgi:hypothetical protein